MAETLGVNEKEIQDYSEAFEPEFLHEEPPAYGKELDLNLLDEPLLEEILNSLSAKLPEAGPDDRGQIITALRSVHEEIKRRRETGKE